MKTFIMFLLLSLSVFSFEKPYYVVKEKVYDKEEVIVYFMMEDDISPFDFVDIAFARMCYALKYAQIKYPDKKIVSITYSTIDGKPDKFHMSVSVEKKYLNSINMNMEDIPTELLLYGDFISDIQLQRILINKK